MTDEEFKKLRYRFWKLGAQKRLKILQAMGFADPEIAKQFITPVDQLPMGLPTAQHPEGAPPKPETLENETVQRRILYAIAPTSQLQRLVELIEIQEEILASEEEEKQKDTLRVPGVMPWDKPVIERKGGKK